MSESRWYVAVDGEKRGPISSQDLRKLVKIKRLKPTDLLWKEGFSDWVEAGTVQGLFTASPPPRQEPARKVVRQKSPAITSVEDEEWLPKKSGKSKAKNRKKKRVRVDLDAKVVHVGHAGFWIRFAALIADALLLFLIAAATVLPLRLFIIVFLPGRALSREFCTNLANIVFGITSVLLLMFYDVLQETSDSQASLGKTWFGLKVMDQDENPLDRSTSLIRHFSKYLSLLTLGIGYLLAGITKEKLALHDMIAGTCVVKAPPKTLE